MSGPMPTGCNGRESHTVTNLAVESAKCDDDMPSLEATSHDERVCFENRLAILAPAAARLSPRTFDEGFPDIYDWVQNVQNVASSEVASQTPSTRVRPFYDAGPTTAAIPSTTPVVRHPSTLTPARNSSGMYDVNQIADMGKASLANLDYPDNITTIVNDNVDDVANGSMDLEIIGPAQTASARARQIDISSDPIWDVGGIFVVIGTVHDPGFGVRLSAGPAEAPIADRALPANGPP
ncbi:hypothetical protein C8R43DRAFT_947434 [Mycena crocata]|nr:hypothetical protein C8R43DRAFT_947434 [Mycena crocata]